MVGQERGIQGYEPFGSLLPGRNYSSDSYRFGFQGQEKDDEVYGATGTSYAFEYRMHDARVGRFMSLDPLAAQYPHNSPYAFAENKLGLGVELEGLELGPMPAEVRAFGNYVEMQVKDAQATMSDAFEGAGTALGRFGNWLKGLPGDGGVTLTSRKRDVPTNNADRKGDPSGEINVDYLLDYTGATRNGPERFSPTLPERGAQTFTEGYNKLWEAGELLRDDLTGGNNSNSTQGTTGANAPGVTTVRDYQVNRTGDTISIASPDGRWNGDKYAPGDTIEVRDLHYEDGNYVGETSTKKDGR